MRVRATTGRCVRRIGFLLSGCCALSLSLTALAWAQPGAPDDPAPKPPRELQMEVDAVSFESYQPPSRQEGYSALAKAAEPVSLENEKSPSDLPGVSGAVRLFRIVQVRTTTSADASDSPAAEEEKVLPPHKLARAYKIAAVLDAGDSIDPTKYGLPKETKVAKVQLVPAGHRIVEVKQVGAAGAEATAPGSDAAAEETPADDQTETPDPFTDDETDPSVSPSSVAALGFDPISKVTVDTSIVRDPEVADELQQPEDEAVLLFLANGEEKDIPRVGDVGLDEWFFLDSASFCQQPLYFEEINLERFGTSRRPILQPVVSGARFFASVPALPYLMTIERPRACYYDGSPYRAGRPAPWHKELPELRMGATTVEGAAITALIFLIP